MYSKIHNYLGIKETAFKGAIENKAKSGFSKKSLPSAVQKTWSSYLYFFLVKINY
jgi:hypothetical protein